MTEQNHIDQPEIDQRAFDLINAGIDAELSESGLDELNRLLADSEQLRDFNKELSAVTSLLDQAPERDPPGYLREAIERQIRLPLGSVNSGKKRGFLNAGLSAYWLRTGFALAAGVVLTVGVYEMGSSPVSDRDVANMAGTLVQGQPGDQGELLGSIQLDKNELNGLVELRNQQDQFTLDIHLKSIGSSKVVVNFADRGLEFVGVKQKQDPENVISIVDSTVSVVSSGEQHYSLQFLRTSVANKVAPLELEFFANQKLVKQAELSVSK